MNGCGASAIADEKKLLADAESMKKQSEDWERRAMLAVQENRDDLAKQALVRYNETLQGAQQLHETWVKSKAETEARSSVAGAAIDPPPQYLPLSQQAQPIGEYGQPPPPPRHGAPGA